MFNVSSRPLVILQILFCLVGSKKYKPYTPGTNPDIFVCSCRYRPSACGWYSSAVLGAGIGFHVPSKAVEDPDALVRLARTLFYNTF